MSRNTGVTWDATHRAQAKAEKKALVAIGYDARHLDDAEAENWCNMSMKGAMTLEQVKEVRALIFKFMRSNDV